MKYFMFVAVLCAFVLSACGAQPVPTVDPAQVQASAVAQANTIVALTQVAMPTDTPTLEASPTPLDTPTPPFDQSTLPTLDLSGSPTSTSQGSTTNCVKPLDMGAAGKKHDTLIKNESSGTINISLNLYKPNEFGECGAISYAGVTKNDSITVGLPAGYWFAYAWGTHNGTSFKTTGYFFVQPAQFLKIELCVRDGLIVYKPTC
jgi:hypothetical protein